MGINLKDFYLNIPIEIYEYMIVSITMIPQDIIPEYKLNDIVHEGIVFDKIRKGMYGLPQAGRLTSNKLVQRL